MVFITKDFESIQDIKIVFILKSKLDFWIPNTIFTERISFQTTKQGRKFRLAWTICGDRKKKKAYIYFSLEWHLRKSDKKTITQKANYIFSWRKKASVWDIRKLLASTFPHQDRMTKKKAKKVSTSTSFFSPLTTKTVQFNTRTAILRKPSVLSTWNNEPPNPDRTASCWTGQVLPCTCTFVPPHCSWLPSISSGMVCTPQPLVS